MTSVLFTIDTELSLAGHQRGLDPSDNFRAAILGNVSDGEWGIAYQAERFNACGLKAVFFVEALSACVVGLDILKRTLEPILSSGNEVQLHTHTEWLQWFARDPVDGRRGQNIADFSYEDQRRLLELGIENLTKAGAPPPVAFRAGNYGANNNTLRALASVGIKYDTSYNFVYLGHPCNIITDRPLLEPTWLEGVIELPIAVFTDYPNHYRPTQLCAVSTSEMVSVIEQSLAQQRTTTVIVSHSFELLNRSRTKANRLVVRRFERLCEMLSERRARAKTTGFTELADAALMEHSLQVAPMQSNIWRTASRTIEQAIGSVLYG